MNDRLRGEIATFLNSQRNDLAVTLRYEANGPMSIDRIRRDLNDLHAVVDRRIYGRKFHLSPDRSSYWAAIEMIDLNPHVHMGWHFADPSHITVFLQILSVDLWETRYAKGGTHDVQFYDPDGYSGENGWAGYATKSLQVCDHLILPPDYRHRVSCRNI